MVENLKRLYGSIELDDWKHCVKVAKEENKELHKGKRIITAAEIIRRYIKAGIKKENS